MQPYSADPTRRAWQVVADVAAVAVLALSIWLSVEASRAVGSLARFGLQMQDSGSQLSETMRGAADALEGVPFVGPGLGTPFVEAGSAADGLTTAGVELETAVGALAGAVGLAVWAVPAFVLVLVWLVPRLRFARRAAEAARIARMPVGRDLLALRAIAARPLRDLAAVSDDPLAALRSGDAAVLDRLADLELRASGARRVRARSGTER